MPKASKRQAKLLTEERRAAWEQSGHSDPTNPRDRCHEDPGTPGAWAVTAQDPAELSTRIGRVSRNPRPI